jgi:DNA-binding NarL/FixJ family response regulator
MIIMFDASFQNLIAQLPGMVFYKNLDLVYSAVSTYTAQLCGFKDATEMCGQNDFSLKCLAVESAHQFQEEDRQVITTGKEITCLQIHQYADDQVHIFLIKKSPVKDRDNTIIGICCVGNEITNPAIGKILYNLLSLEKSKESLPDSFYKNTDTTELYNQLSERESELIFYFMRGFSNKEIASYMSLSPRTVETYLERIKSKFNCNTRSKLQVYCMLHGFMYILPKTILRNYLNKSVTW